MTHADPTTRIAASRRKLEVLAQMDTLGEYAAWVKAHGCPACYGDYRDCTCASERTLLERAGAWFAQHDTLRNMPLVADITARLDSIEADVLAYDQRGFHSNGVLVALIENRHERALADLTRVEALLGGVPGC